LRKLPSNIDVRLVLRFGRMGAMSKSTPADLAVAYRSLTRRRADAIDAAKDAPVGALVTSLDEHIAAAASVVGSAPNPGAVAEAIERRKLDDWDDRTLDELRRLATEAGTVVRRIADAAPPDD
jgi:hypothetical protein